MQCTAKTRSGGRCKNNAINGTSKCRMHGGSSLAGIASPTFKTGRYSKHLPSHLAARYGEVLDDPELMALRDEVALIGTRQTELLDRLESGLSPRRWAAAQVAFNDLMTAIGEKDNEAGQAAVRALGMALDTTVHEGAIWDEVVALGEQRRKLVESEQKRLLAAQQLISVEQGMALIARLTESVRRHVSDPSILAAIAADLRAVVNAGTGG